MREAAMRCCGDLIGHTVAILGAAAEAVASAPPTDDSFLGDTLTLRAAGADTTTKATVGEVLTGILGPFTRGLAEMETHEVRLQAVSGGTPPVSGTACSLCVCVCSSGAGGCAAILCGCIDGLARGGSGRRLVTTEVCTQDRGANHRPAGLPHGGILAGTTVLQ